ncbi:hypothetical protein Q7P36_001786 [Cladosporium allicinum]
MAEQNWCPATVSAATSVCATQQSNSPCPSPTCDSCRFAPSATTTSSSQVSSPVLSPAAGKTSSAAYQCEPQTHDECSHLVPMMMAYCRAAAAAAAVAAPIPSRQPLPSPILETKNFNKRVETAIASSTTLIAQAKAQLAAPKIAPAELTAEEQAEAERESAWNASYQQKEIAIACISSGNQALYHGQELAALLNDAEMENLTVPDCDDLLTWNANSGVVAKAECTESSILGESKELPQAVPDTGKPKDPPQKKSKGPIWQNVYNSKVGIAW